MLKKLIRSFSYAISGFAFAFRNHFNLRVHVMIMFVVILASFILRLSPTEWCIILLCIGSVIAAELVNTSLEVTVDISSPQVNEKAGQAKDIAAASVVMVAFISGIIGLIVFLPKILIYFK